jgi:hypothetical protein
MKSAYGRQTAAPDYELTCVEPGSPMGELMRRYWQPVCIEPIAGFVVISLTDYHSPPSREQVPPHGCWNLRPYPRRIRMLTSEARALVTEIQDRLIDLYVQQDEARGEHDPDRARELQVEIDKATAQREEIRR